MSVIAAAICGKYDLVATFVATGMVVRRACECHQEREKKLKHFSKILMVNKSYRWPRELIPRSRCKPRKRRLLHFWEVVSIDRGSW